VSCAGKVVLLGAGPGAADLLTVRATRALAKADVISVVGDVGHELDALAILHDGRGALEGIG
jgi:uroporphyrin-III C-methyltransferase